MVTPRGGFKLSESDAALANQLGEELGLAGAFCVELLHAACEEYGEVSLEAAGGVYMAAREAQLGILLLVLRSYVEDDGAAGGGAFREDLEGFVESLLVEGAGGGDTLLDRLVQLLRQGTGAEVAAEGAATQFVLYEGQLVDRAVLAEREKSMVARCVLYLAGICRLGLDGGAALGAQEAPVGTALVEALAGVVAAGAQRAAGLGSGGRGGGAQQGGAPGDGAAGAARTGGGGAAGGGSEAQQHRLAAVQQSYTCAAALALFLCPQPEEISSAKRQRLQLAAGQALGALVDPKVQGALDNGFLGVLAVIWATAALEQGGSDCAGGSFPDTSFVAVLRPSYPALSLLGGGAADNATGAGAEARDAFRFLQLDVLESTAFQDEEPAVVAVVARACHAVVMYFLDQIDKSDGGLDLFSGIQADEAEPAVAPLCISVMELLTTIYRLEPDLVAETRRLRDLLTFSIETSKQEPAVFTSTLRLMTSLAAGRPGASEYFGRLLQPPVDTYGGMHPSWAQLYSVLWEYNALFLKEDIAVMSEVEAEGLVAYVDLLAQVLERGTLEDLEGWIKDLAGLELPGLSPFHWDVVSRYAVHPAAPFFLLQQQPVPIRMKAALLGAVASFSRHAASVETLWSILNQAEMLRQGKPQRLVQGTVRTDVTYQLAEVESRAAEYSSTLALVRLLNRLVRAAQDGHCTFPTHSAPYARFVQESVFCGLAARKYRREEQKWELASECLRFIRSCVAISVQQLKCQQGPRRGPQDDQLEVGGAAEAGLAFISDLFLRGRAFGALMGLLEMGVDGLRALRQESSAGAAAEEAVKEALGLLHQAMITEESLLSALRQRSERETVGMQSLPAALQQREIHTVLEYVEYPFLPAIQRSSVELATLLESSRSDLLSILMSPRTGHGHPAGLDRVQFLQRLLQGYSQCLADGSAVREASAVGAGGAALSGGGDRSSDGRADLVLNLLLAPLQAERPAPNLSHLLLGFDVEHGVYSSALDPQRQATPLKTMLEMLAGDREGPGAEAEAEKVVHVLCLLMADPSTFGPTFDLLHGPPLELLHEALGSMCRRGPPQSCSSARVSYLHKMGWLLHVQTSTLHHANPGVHQQAAACEAILHLLLSAESGAAAGLEAPILWEILHHVSRDTPTPSLARGADVRPCLEWLGVDALLASQDLVGAGGVLEVSEHGSEVFHIPTLGMLLFSRFKALEKERGWAPGDGDRERAKGAVECVLLYAQERAEYVEEVNAQLHLMEAVQQFVTVTCQRRWDTLAALSRNTGSCFADGSFTSLMAFADCLLRYLAAMLPASAEELALCLVRSVGCILSALREHSAAEGVVVMPVSQDAVGDFKISSGACHQLLSLLLEVLKKAPPAEPFSEVLLTALLDFCRCCSLSRQLLQGSPGQVLELDRGNQRIFESEAKQVVAILAKYAAEAKNTTQALALEALAKLSELDASNVILQETVQSGLPVRLGWALKTAPVQALSVTPPEASAEALAPHCALVRLLARIASLGEQGAATVCLQDVAAAVCACEALDIPLQDASGISLDAGRPSLLERYEALLEAALEFTVQLAPWAGARKEIAGALKDFCEQHAGAVERALLGATRPGPPRAAELRVLSRTATLLGTLLPDTLEPLKKEVAARFQTTLFSLCWHVLPLDAKYAQSKYVILAREGLRAKAGPSGATAGASPAASGALPGGGGQAEDLGMLQEMRELRFQLVRFLYRLAQKGELAFPFLSRDPALQAPDAPPSLQLMLQTAREGLREIQLLLSRRQVLEAASAKEGGAAGAGAATLRALHAAIEKMLVLVDACVGVLRASLEGAVPASYADAGAPRIEEAAFFFSSPQCDDVLRFSHLAVQVLAEVRQYDSQTLGFDVTALHQHAQQVEGYAGYFLGLKRQKQAANT